jgi:hypothetical protein
MTELKNDPAAGLPPLPVGIVWVCRACPAQGRYVHPQIDAARHDAAEHAVWWHRDPGVLAEIELKLITAEEKSARALHELDLGVTFVPPIEPLYTAELPLFRRRQVCDLVACPEDSRHRRQQAKEHAAMLAGVEAGLGKLSSV